MKLKYNTIDLLIDEDKQAHHICVDDLVDIIVIKGDDEYKVKVLSIPNHTPTVSCEMVDIDDYNNILDLE